MNNKKIIEEVLNNPKNHGIGTINLMEKALVMKEENLKTDRYFTTCQNCGVVVEDTKQVSKLKKALAMKDAEHLEFLKRFYKNCKEEGTIFEEHDKRDIEEEISRLEGEGKEK